MSFGDMVLAGVHRPIDPAGMPQGKSELMINFYASMQILCVVMHVCTSISMLRILYYPYYLSTLFQTHRPVAFVVLIDFGIEDP